ncbi:MAG: hypothetical protein ACTHOC_00740 [Luteimonas sp.]
MLATRSLAADTDLPALQRLAASRYPLLLESSAAGTAQGRWDILLAAGGESLELMRDGTLRRDGTTRGGGPAHGLLDWRDAPWGAARRARGGPRWPVRGGWALVLA